MTVDYKLDFCLNTSVSNQPFREAYEAAASELEGLLKEQGRIDDRILSLRKTMNALATLISQNEDKNDDFLERAAGRLRDLIDTGITQDIHRIIASSSEPLTATEIREQLKELGNSLAEQSNPMATIHAILNRLTESGRAKETVKNGKKAWDRYMTLTERVRASQGRFKGRF